MATIRKVRIVSGGDGQLVGEDAYTDRSITSNPVPEKTEPETTQDADTEEYLQVLHNTRFF